MVPSVDDKKYATDNRKFSDAVVSDGVFSTFTDSPLSDKMLVKDVCVYAPGDLNKIGKEGKTSWDSFSYAIQMAHNVWHHINAVQEANRQYDNGVIPNMLVEEQFDRLFFKDVVEAIFSTSNKDEAEAVILEFSRYWDTIIGTRGNTGKRITNADTHFNNLFNTEYAFFFKLHVSAEKPITIFGLRLLLAIVAKISGFLTVSNNKLSLFFFILLFIFIFLFEDVLGMNFQSATAALQIKISVGNC